MEDKNKGTGMSYPGDAISRASPSVGESLEPFNTDAMSVGPIAESSGVGATTSPISVSPNSSKPWFRRAALAAMALLLLGTAGFVFVLESKRESNPSNVNSITNRFKTTVLSLGGIHVEPTPQLSTAKEVIINGQLTANQGLVVSPSVQPASARKGQIYYDQGTDQLAYYNGTEFVSLSSGQVVSSIGTLAGQVGLGNGLSIVGNQLVNSGVLSLGGQTGAITLGNGLGMSGNVLQNNGVVGLVAGSGIGIVNNGSGSFTISNTGAGSGTVTSAGGTAGHVALFNSAQDIGDSIVTQSGVTVTVSGDLAVVTGGLSLSNALTVSNGGTGATSLAANGVIVGNGTSALSAVTAGAAGLCLLSTAGAPSFAACPSASGVTSLNSLTGALSIANASGAGATITIDNASTVAKGIASFNSTNFTVTSGAVNTIQNINSGATPTFAGLNTNSITPSSTLTVGASGQTLILQGDGGTVLKATSAGNTTTIGFTAPTANVTINFPALSVGSYTVCTTSGNCLGGAGGGANTALSNLSGVAINTSLIPGAAGTVNLGSATLPFGELFLAGTSGTPGTNNFKITGASTSGTRTITLPDATGTVCLTTGNCAGSGGGVTTSGGTIGTLPVFTAAQQIGDSLVSQSGGVVSVNGNLNLSAGGQYRINGSQISSADLSNDSNLAKLSASQTFTGATNAFKNGANSTNAFNIQNAGGTRVLTADTTNGQVILGVGSTLDGKLVFNNVSNTNSVTIAPGTPTVDRTLTLPDADGIICTDSGNCAGAGATLQTAYNFSVGGTTPKIKVNNTLNGVDIQDADVSIGTSLFNVRASNGAGLGSAMFSVGNTGAVTFQNSSNSATAFRLLTQGGTSVLTGDTTNGEVILGQSTTLNGALVFNNATNSNQITLTTAAAGSNQTITLPNATGTVCLTSGNCAGVGGTGDILQNGNSFGTAVTLGTNDANALNLETSNVTRLTIAANGSDVTLSSNTDLFLQGATAYISNPQTGTSSEAFGAGATMSNGAQFATSVGNSANAVTRGTALGYLANAGDSTIAIGASTDTSSAGGSIAIGYNAHTTGFAGSIAIGTDSVTTATNQLVIGSGSNPVTQAIFGNGVTSGAPSGVVIGATSGSGTDIQGAALTLAGGKGTGAGNGGAIVLQIATPSGSGGTLNTLTSVVTIDGTNGSALFKNATNSSTGFRIQNAAGTTSALTVDTTGSTAVTVAGNLTVNGGAINSSAAATASALAIKPGDSTANDATGAGASLAGGNTTTGTCATLCTGGSVTIQGGAATANPSGTRNGGSIFIDAGAGATSNGAINIGTLTSADMTIGKTTGSNSLLLQAGHNVTVLNNDSAGTIAIRTATNSSNGIQLQDSGSAPLLTADTSARSGSGGNLIKIGNSTGTDGATTILQLDAATADPTSNLSALNGGLFYNSTTNKVSLIENGQVKIICNTVDLGCGTGTVTLQNAYHNSTGGTTSEIIAESTQGALDIQDRSTSNGGTLGGNLLNVRATAATDSTAGSLLFGIGNTGAVSVQNSSDSTTALRVQNAAGTDTVFDLDTTNQRLGVNTSAPGSTLQVYQSKLAPGTVSNSASSANVTGSSTTFLTTFQPGDSFTITSSGNTCTVLQVTSNTALVCTAALAGSSSGSTYSFTQQARLSVADSGMTTFGGTLLVTNSSSTARQFTIKDDPADNLFKISANSVGSTATGSGGSDANANTIDATKFNSGSGGTINSLRVWFPNVDGANPHFKVAVYDDNSGTPNNRLSSATAPSTVATGRAWNTASLGTTVTLAPNTNYWLALTTETGVTTFGRDTNGTSNQSKYIALTWGSNFPATFGTPSCPSQCSADIIAIYAPYVSITDQSYSQGAIRIDDNNGVIFRPLYSQNTEGDGSGGVAQHASFAVEAADGTDLLVADSRSKAIGIGQALGINTSDYTYGLNVLSNGSSGNVNFYGNNSSGTYTLLRLSSNVGGSDVTKLIVQGNGVVQLNGGQTADLTTAAAATATAITLQPGTSSGASSNGPATTVKGGDGSGTTNVTGGALTLQGGSATGASGTRNGGGVTINGGTGATANGAITIGSLTTNNGNSVTIAGTATAVADTVNIATGNTTVAGGKTVHIADGTPSGSGTNVVTIGSITALANTTTIQGGNGSSAIQLLAAASGTITVGTTTAGTANTVNINNASNAGTVSVGAGMTTGTISIGGASQTGTITVGMATTSQTINIGAAQTATGNTLTVNMATSATGTGKAVVTIGNTNDGSSITLQAGTGNISMLTTGNVTIGTADSTGTLLVLDTKNTSGDPTGVDGAMYYNSNMAMMRCYYDGVWHFCNDPASLSWGYNFADDFISYSAAGFGPNPWAFDVGAGTAAGVTNETVTDTKRPGILGFHTGTTNNSGDASIFFADETDAWQPFLIGGGEVIESAVELPTLSTATNEYTARFDLCDNFNGGDCTDGLYFEYNRLTSTNWSLVSANNTTRTRIQNSNAACTAGSGTSVAVAANTWTRFKIVVNSNATKADYYINGTFVGCITTNIPTTRTTGPEFAIRKSAGTADNIMYADYINIRNSFTSQR